MRSAAYSLLTTLLLLAPISAVPLMAIFGVPQFTPVVASPLDENDDDDWNRPSRKPTRTKPAAEALSDEELDLIAEETLSWDEPAKERPKPIKKTRTRARETPKSPAEDLASFPPDDLKPAPRKTKTPGGKSRPLPIPDEEDDVVEFASASSTDSNDQKSGVDHADFSREADESPKKEAGKSPEEIPSYRRQRPGNGTESARPGDKLADRSKRTAPAVETLSWSKAVVRLNELGIRNFKLEPGMRPGEFTFTCSYTPTNSPHVTRKFEAEADDPLKAVSQVLTQVERWAQQRESVAPKRMAETAEAR